MGKSSYVGNRYLRKLSGNLSVSGCLCSPVVSVARESVTSAVKLVAVLDIVGLEVSSDQLIVDFVAELVSGILLQCLLVDHRDTVVAPPPIVRSLVIDRSCNR